MKNAERDRAIQLRESGWSIKQIKRELKVSASSVSRWVRNISLDEQKIAVLKERHRQNAYLTAHKLAKRRQELERLALQEGRERIAKDNDFGLICALYWGEGTKAIRDCRLSNCDPAMIKFFVRWLIKEGLSFSITLHYYLENGLSEDDIRKWWMCKIPELKPFHFRKGIVRTYNSGSKKKNVGKLPYGTGEVRVIKGSRLLYQIMGGIDQLSNKFIVE